MTLQSSTASGDRGAPPAVLNGAALGLVMALVLLQQVEWRERRPCVFTPADAAGVTAIQAGAQTSGGGYLTRGLGGVARDDAGKAWAAANGVTPRLAFSHNLSRIFPPALHGPHPEFFPLENGKRIAPSEGFAWWNPDLGREDVAAWAAEAARKHFDANPDAVSFAVGVNDGLVFGESEETLAALARRKAETLKAERLKSEPITSAYPGAWFRERPDFSNLVFQFTNRVAEEVSRTHPDKYIGALAYYWAENTPEFPLHPNVIPFLTADRSQGYDRAFWEEEKALQRRWKSAADAARRSEMGDGSWGGETRSPAPAGRHPGAGADAPARRMGLYDYLYGNGFLVPRIHTRLMAEHLREARRLGFTDYYAEVNPNWGLDGPMPWLTAQLLQDPEQSPEVLLEDYYRGFGDAAVPMRRFFQRCERQWMMQRGRAYWLKHFRNESQAEIFPAQVCRELRGLLQDALASCRGEVERKRVRLISEAFGVTERFVALQEARERLVGAAISGPWTWQQIIEAARQFADRRDEFVRYTKELQAREPRAVAAFNWDDYLRHDPLSSALRVLRKRVRNSGEPAAVDAAINAAGTSMQEAWRLSGVAESPLQSTDVLRDPAMTGEIRPARVIAGLHYGLALPESWASYVEPAQFQRAGLISGDAASRVLRFTGNKETSVFQWNPLAGHGLYVARAKLRGRVSPTGVVSLTFGWLDAKQQRLGLKTVRLPAGEWMEWTRFQIVEERPEGAEWVGMGVRVQHQEPGDWAEAAELELRRVN